MQTNGDSQRPRRQHTVGAVAKALDVLEQLVWAEPRTIGELANSSGVEKAAVYRILNTFVAHGFAVKDEDTRTFAPGPRLYAAAGMLHEGTDLVSLASAQMEQLVQEFEETVNLGVLVDHEVRYLHIVESPHNLRMSIAAGVHHPAHSTALGKAVLAQLGPETAESALRRSRSARRTKRTIADLDTLQRELSQVLERGYAVDYQENEDGAICVAAAIMQPGSAPKHAMSISGPANRMTDDVVERAGSRLIEACAAVSDLLPRE